MKFIDEARIEVIAGKGGESFASLDELVAQIRADCEAARAYYRESGN